MTTIPAGIQGAPIASVPPILQPESASLPPSLKAALEDLWGALGALRGALEGAGNLGPSANGGGPGLAAGGAPVSGGGSGCACMQASQGAAAGANGAPAGASGAPDAAPKQKKKRRQDDAPKPAEATSSGPGSAPSGTKLVNPLPGAKKTSNFGSNEAFRNGRAHGGQDLAKSQGTPIVAAAAGKVVEVKNDADGYGHYITIDHGGGRYTRYAHMVEQSPLKQGQTVNAGDNIGKVGSTGNSTGPHLHFEVLIGGLGSSNRVDPAPYLDGSKTL